MYLKYFAVMSVRDLGIYIDAHLSMRAHVKRTVTLCFAAIRQLLQIRRVVPTATFQILVVALVHTRDSTTAMQYWSAYLP